VLRIPADWVQESLRCRHCNRVFRFQPTPKPHLRDDFFRHQLALIGLGLLGMATVVAAVCWAMLHTPRAQHAESSAPADTAPHPPKPEPVVLLPVIQPQRPPTAAPKEDPLPRRALAISLSNYLYANPIHPGSGGHDVHSLLQLLARAWHIAPGQVVELNDRAAKGKPPWKAVIEGTIGRFLDTSRAQDRILILFVGHGVVVDGQPYLVPLEGELTAKGTLIPLAWLVDRLAACRARQKALILDVCRSDPDRGAERPDGGPLGTAWETVLRKPPPGVEIWSACAPGEFSYEVESGRIAGGIFVTQLAAALAQAGKSNPAGPRPHDPLPLCALARIVNQRTTAEAQRLLQVRQTPQLVGQEAAGGAPYNPKEALPRPMAIPAPPNRPGGASADEIRSIWKEIDILGLKMTRESAGTPRPEFWPPFLAKDLEEYRAPVGRDPLQDAVEKARDLLNQKIQAKRLRDKFPAAANDRQFQQQVLDDEKTVAKILAPLTEALEELQKVGKERAKRASRRWQANYAYVRARLTAQVAYLYEYESLLGQMRKQKPPRDAKLHVGWQLVAREKMQGDTVGKKLAAEAHKLQQQLIADYPRTPWAALARRDRLTRLGLDWQASRLGK
jgi:hypothetical protein